MDPDDPVLADHQAQEIEFAASTGKNSSSRVRIQIAARELGRFLERPAVTHKLQFAQEFLSIHQLGAKENAGSHRHAVHSRILPEPWMRMLLSSPCAMSATECRKYCGCLQLKPPSAI